MNEFELATALSNRMKAFRLHIAKTRGVVTECAYDGLSLKRDTLTYDDRDITELPLAMKMRVIDHIPGFLLELAHSRAEMMHELGKAVKQFDTCMADAGIKLEETTKS